MWTRTRRLSLLDWTDLMRTLTILLVPMGLVGFQVMATAQTPPAPVEIYKLFKQDIGQWDAEITAWIGGQETRSKGAAIVRKQGEYWLLCQFKARVGKVPMMGQTTIAYDPQTKGFTGSWYQTSAHFDSWFHHINTNPLNWVAAYEPESKTMTMGFKGKNAEGNPVKGKLEFVYKDAKTRIMKIYVGHSEEAAEMEKSMEIVFRKRSHGGNGSE